jgi:hypothetical protein
MFRQLQMYEYDLHRSWLPCRPYKTVHRHQMPQLKLAEMIQAYPLEQQIG